MRTRARRRIDLILLAVGGLLVAAVGVVGAVAGDSERVTGLWAGAEVSADGAARVVEVIDYDFGSHRRRRHGIFRDVPGLAPDAAVTVHSETAPVPVQLSPIGGNQVRIRIGDPALTVTGRHRYTVGYPLGGVVRDGRLAWDAVGTAWRIPLSQIEIHVVAPFQFQDVRCVQGAAGSVSPCAGIDQPEPGHLVARQGRLEAGEGVTLFASGTPLASAPALPAPPSGIPADPGTGLPATALVAGLAGLAAAAVISVVVRRAGRERVATGGAVGAAWAEPGGERLVDPARLASLATIEFAPPPELTAAQGGVVLAEAVRKEHRVAWLISAAIDGYLEVEEDGDGKVVLVRRQGRSRAPGPVYRMFGGRDRVTLGTYDEAFAAGWDAVGEELRRWRERSGLWDPAGDHRRIVALVLGGLIGLIGLALTGLGGALANRQGPGFLALVAIGAVLAGAGIAAVVGAWELRVRTPAGAGLWLRVESFRRFLAESEAHHADEAAKRGVLREYTAWAVAVGEIDRWSRSVALSTAASDPAVSRYAFVAPHLTSASSATAVEPSSSGNGGGGGGVGGGGGGGGGGSW